MGGTRAAVASRAPSTLVVWYFFLPPYHTFAIHSATTFGQLTVFILEGAGIATIVARMHRAREASTASAARKAAILDSASDAIVTINPR